MRLVILLGLLLGPIWSASAQDERQITLPFNVELNRPITFESTLQASNSGIAMTMTEVTRVTAVRQDGDNTVYQTEVLSTALESSEGLPPFLEGVMQQLLSDAMHVKFQYVADGTGYPIELAEAEELTTFYQKLKDRMLEWADNYGRESGWNAQQQATATQFIAGWFAPFLADDKEALAREVLEEGQQYFYGTGRSLYLDYYTEFPSTRYFDKGQVNFHTTDSWEVRAYDEDAKEAVIGFTQALNDEEYQAFLVRLRDMLEEQNGPELQDQIDTLVDQYANLELTREGEYVIDLDVGLPKSGRIESKQIFQGRTDVRTISFTTSY